RIVPSFLVASITNRRWPATDTSPRRSETNRSMPDTLETAMVVRLRRTVFSSAALLTHSITAIRTPQGTSAIARNQIRSRAVKTRGILMVRVGLGAVTRPGPGGASAPRLRRGADGPGGSRRRPAPPPAVVEPLQERFPVLAAPGEREGRRADRLGDGVDDLD